MNCPYLCRRRKCHHNRNGVYALHGLTSWLPAYYMLTRPFPSMCPPIGAGSR